MSVTRHGALKQSLAGSSLLLKYLRSSIGRLVHCSMHRTLVTKCWYLAVVYGSHVIKYYCGCEAVIGYKLWLLLQ